MTSREPSVVVVVPTYEERENVADLLRALVGHGYAALVVDDASPDGTGVVADRLAAELPSVEVIHRPERNGLGPAYVAGFDRALAAGFSVVCGMDADLSHDPAVLPELVAPLVDDEVQMVIGSRYVPGGATRGWPLHRLILSRSGNAYARYMLGTAVKDTTSGYRAFRAEALRMLGYSTCHSVGYLFLTEMVWRARQRGLRIREVPIVFRERRRGHSKMSLRIILEAMWLVTRWGLRRRLGF